VSAFLLCDIEINEIDWCHFLPYLDLFEIPLR